MEIRTQVLHDVAASSHEARLGVLALRNTTLLFFYGLPDQLGENPNWPALGYPGPISAPPSPEQAPVNRYIVIDGVTRKEAVNYNSISDRYFSTMSARLLAGRDFDRRDSATAFILSRWGQFIR